MKTQGAPSTLNKLFNHEIGARDGLGPQWPPCAPDHSLRYRSDDQLAQAGAPIEERGKPAASLAEEQQE
eukprot:7159526-Pyramimonas_sp.AAC.1